MKPDKFSHFSAVCFDFKGTLIDHQSGRDIIGGMPSLLKTLKAQGLILAVVSRNPTAVVTDALGPLAGYFKDRVYSSGGKGKLGCLRGFAADHRIDHLADIAFVDDKADNLIPVFEDTDIAVIGFRGSGKYPQTRNICRQRGIPFAETVDELAALLQKRGKTDIPGR